MKFDDESGKLDRAVANASDKLDELLSTGELNDYILDEVLVIAAFKPEDNQTDSLNGSLVIVEGSTSVPHVQAGILYLAINTVVTGGSNG